MVKAKVFIFEKKFQGFPKPGDLKLIQEDLPPIKEGEFLAEAVFLSVDPYMQTFSDYLPLGSPFHGQQVALIRESKNPDYPVGKYVVDMFGWRTHTVASGKVKDVVLPLIPFIVPDFKGLPISLALGTLGMTGNTAYFGFLEICKPKQGETVVVSGAAGAVGSIVGQIAKIKKCKVIGIASSKEKLEWLIELGFDGVINYKTENVGEALKQLAPEGADCYFDTVGGEITETVLGQMKEFGRVAICGQAPIYNDQKPKGIVVEFPILAKQLKVEGFHVMRWEDRYLEGITQLQDWVKAGEIKYQEKVTVGFENAFDAFVNVLKGKNTGKAIVKI